jgi:hypothetical protein
MQDGGGVAINTVFLDYLCTQKRTRTGCASAIQVNLIPFGLHRPCT